MSNVIERPLPSRDTLCAMSTYWLPNIVYGDNSAEFRLGLGDYVSRMDRDTILTRYGSGLDAREKAIERMSDLEKRPVGRGHLLVGFKPGSRYEGFCHGIAFDNGLVEIGMSTALAYRGKGVGYAMLRVIMEQAIALCHGGLYISTGKRNRGMQNLAQAIGCKHDDDLSNATDESVWILDFVEAGLM